MNGPSFHPQPSPSQKGGPMEKKETAPKWTPADQETGDKLLSALEHFDGTFNQKRHHAARMLGYKGGYDDIQLEGVRSYISHMASLAKANKKSTADKMSTERHLAQMKADYEKLMATDPGFFQSRFDDADDLQAAIEKREAEKMN
jgi:hypothetical protein